MTVIVDVVGATPERRTTVREFSLGQTGRDNVNRAWIYVKASEAVATGTCTVNATTFLLTDTGGNFTADTAFASGEYGWVRKTAADLS